MNENLPSQAKRKLVADYLGLATLSYAAPLIAYLLFMFYGITFWGPPDRFSIFLVLGLCGVFAIPTLLVLLPFRKRQINRWLMWTISIGFWAWLWFYFGRP